MSKQDETLEGVNEPNGTFNTGALVDLIVVMAVLIGVKQSLLPITQLYAGPASTLSAMVVGTFLLWRRGLKWSDLGLRWPQSWPKTLGLTVLTLVVMLAALAATGYVADLYFEDIGTSGRFDHVEGNFLAYLGVMALIWTHAAFFEELLFRAFIINRAGTALGGGLWASLGAVVFAALFFGYRHYYYQGLNGALTIAGVGLALGLLYLWFGRRNLLPLILAHGFIDTLGMTFRFLGIED